MSPARIGGVVLVLLGIAAGTALDRQPPRDIPRVDGLFVLAGDFHVHAFVGDGGLAPWQLSQEAARRDLDVIAVTNHNQRIAALIAARGQREQPANRAMVLVGQEITAPLFHMAAAGIREVIDWRLSAADAIRAVHAEGGVAIAAHPTPESWRTGDREALSLLDGAEVAHPAVLESADGARRLAAFFDTASAGNPSLAPIASSDFHFGGALGLCRTYLFVDEVSERGVLDAIRQARTVAYDGRGGLRGAPERVRAVAELIAKRPPPQGADAYSRIASGLALGGLLMLLLLR